MTRKMPGTRGRKTATLASYSLTTVLLPLLLGINCVGTATMQVSGDSCFPAELELSSLDGPKGFVINGEAEYDYSGGSVSYAGDVNGDNIADIIIGAHLADPNGISSAGKSYVVFGKNTAESTSFPTELELSSLDGTNGFAINGEAEDDRNGISVSYAGDVNGDTIDDIIVGARDADPNGKFSAGKSYVVFGKNISESSNFPSELELSSLNGTNGFAINGEASDDWSGISASYTGDVNGDNVADIIIGAYGADPNGIDWAGKSYVVFGKNTAESTNFPSEFELSSLDGTNGFAINGEVEEDWSGGSVSYAGDVNGDSIADTIIGAPSRDGTTSAGKSYVVFGNNTAESPTFPSDLNLTSLDGANGFAINGEANGDRSGFSVSYAGDVNGDNVGDIIIGAYHADPNDLSEAGTSYVVFGKNTSESTSFPSELNLISLNGTNGFAIHGEAGSDYSGFSVSYAGDVNVDNIDDIIIGARRADPNGKHKAGTSYVVFGRNTSEATSVPSELELSSLDGTNGFAINGQVEGDWSGFSVSYAGDVNGDTIDDIIIGAFEAAPNGIVGAGKSYVVFGTDCISSTNSLTSMPTPVPTEVPTTPTPDDEEDSAFQSSVGIMSFVVTSLAAVLA